MPERSVRLPGVDIRATLRPQGVFTGDPTHRWATGSFARAVLTPVGPGELLLTWDGTGTVDAEAWGPGADWLLDAVPRWLGVDDDPSGFAELLPPRLADAWRRRPFRLGGSGVIWQELAFAILGQRVTTHDASESWRRIVHRWGEPAPGPNGLRLPPAPEVLAGVGYVELHRVNVERRRADAMLLAARRATRLEEAAAMAVDDAVTRLTALPGLGIWTATATLTTSHGDPDLVIIGDYGLPTLVSHACTGDGRRVDDARMLELLEPFRGHRWRFVRLLYTAGVGPPRRAPRARNPRIADL
jgi:3-methyladenine DNA glycosylase/8-oxoguanine DNA glycosylase